MTMIEQVARAIYPEAWSGRMQKQTIRQGKHREASIVKARAAIKAMREPSAEIETEFCNPLTGERRQMGRKLWGVMINAALSE